MKLIDLLVKELPKLGGWPDGAVECCRHNGSNSIDFYDKNGNWNDDCYLKYGKDFAKDCTYEASGEEFLQSISRAQYEAALAKNDGWIEWGGGECPVDEARKIDLKYRDGRMQSGIGLAQDWRWRHEGNCSDIIAYRLHRDINSRSNDDRLEHDLNECIGQDGYTPCSDAPFPPEGIEIEYSTHGQKAWYRGIVTACGESMCIVKNLSGAEQAFHKFDIEFRPLRTEAEKSKSMAIGAMERSWEDVMNKPAQSFEIIYEAIAAGKIPGIKLEKK